MKPLMFSPEMEKQIHHALRMALFKVLKALVRLALRFGMSYDRFDEIVRQAFVAVAEQELTLPGRKQTDSRIAVVTGLTRKEVKRLRILTAENSETPIQHNRAARVLYAWLRKQAYLDAHGQPLAVLPMEGEAPSFSALVREHAGDIPVRAVFDELQRIGIVERDKTEQVHLLQHAYVPADNIAEGLQMLGDDAAALLTTTQHNLFNTEEKTYLQLKVAYDNLPAEALPVLRKVSAEEGQELLQKLNRWFAAQDRDANPEIKGTDRYRAGVGVYFFAHPVDEAAQTHDEIKNNV